MFATIQASKLQKEVGEKNLLQEGKQFVKKRAKTTLFTNVNHQ